MSKLDSTTRALATAAVPKPRRRFKWNSAAIAAFYVGLLLLWELICQLGWVAPYVLPAPSAIAQAMIAEWPTLMYNTWITLSETLLGFLIGSLIGFAIGIVIAYSAFLERLIYPAIVITQTVPKLALAPLFIIWFGVGLTPKVAITALICLFPVLINTVTGIKAVDPRLRQLMRSVSASRMQQFFMIDFPSSMPFVFAGLQVGITLAVTGALVGEWVGASEGLGYAILASNSQLRTASTFGSIVMISLLGVALFVAVRVLERIILPHQPKPSLTDAG